MSRIVRKHGLPEKLLVVHRFISEMIRNEHRLERHPGVAVTVNVDGFGDRPNKISKYRRFTPTGGTDTMGSSSSTRRTRT
jgi:hypothetical protein